jgi:hypothetical protein
MWHGKWAQAIERMRGVFLGVGRAVKFLRPVDAERAQRFRSTW